MPRAPVARVDSVRAARRVTPVLQGVAPLLAALLFACSGHESLRTPTSLRAARVANTVTLTASSLVRIRTENDTITTTPEHPFARLGSGWTPAAKLLAGDQIASASQQGAVTIRSIELVRTPPTTVYNLSVEPGRAYYVGASELLVHNMDCRPGPSERPPRPLVNDTRQRANCGFCTLAALLDTSVSKLNRRMVWPHNDGVTIPRMQHYLWTKGLIPHGEQAKGWLEETAFGEPTLPERFERVVRNQGPGQSNTFALFYSREVRVQHPPGSGLWRTELEGHIITAVRRDDGSTLYIDFQTEPPTTSRMLNPDIGDLHYWPTTADYKYNRHMMDALRNGRRVPIIE